MARVMMRCDDPVRVTCYRQTKTWEREDAIAFYLDCMMNSEGSERDRYCEIYYQLINGAKEARDE